MKSDQALAVNDNPLLDSYAQLAARLVADTTGVCLFDRKLLCRGQTGGMNIEALSHWLRSMGWQRRGTRSAASTSFGASWITAIPLEQPDGTLLGVFCAQESPVQPPSHASRHAKRIRHELKPLLECVHREMAATLPARSRLQALTERTLELEWLFKLTARMKRSGDDRHLLEELLDVAAKRLGCPLSVVHIPGKNLCIERVQNQDAAKVLLEAWHKSKHHLLSWAQHHKRPLILGRTSPGGRKTRCRILAVPVLRDTEQVIGVLAFYNLPAAGDFAARHIFLARHLGRQAASIIESQFDLMTGLYTRGGLEQASGQFTDGHDAADRCVIYLDVDRMHIVNELHGFELGNELIVRISHLLAPPLIPEGSLAARISADHFAVMLPDDDINAAAKVAQLIRAAARRLKIGPDGDEIEITVSCGVTTHVAMPQGMDRALATAELACKAAKRKGGDRVEVYTFGDGSMRRRHEDVLAVGQLRAALKSDRLGLYAQRIVPLKSSSLPVGYEILLRLVREDGKLVMPAPLIAAAQRYQILPSVDRWVTRRALEMLAPYRGMLASRGLSVSINVSGQSICDEHFVVQLARQIKAARLPADCVTIEITEQSAVTNLPRARELIHELKQVGCQIALDDFGTGSNSLTVLKNLQIARVKIDGSFVRDILTDRNSRATVRAIVELAGGMSIDTVAEYVETKAIADEVRELGVDYAQGYAYGKPEPLDALLTALNDEESQRLHRLFLEA